VKPRFPAFSKDLLPATLLALSTACTAPKAPVAPPSVPPEATEQAGAPEEPEKPAAVGPESATAPDEAPPAAQEEPVQEADPVAWTYAKAKDFVRGGAKLVETRRVATGPLPKSVEVAPDGNTIWVCNFGQVNVDNLWVYDAKSLERIAVVKFKGNAVETTFSPDGTKAYVSNFKRGVVEEVDRSTYKVIREFEVGYNPKIMVPSPDGQWLYVANWSSNDVSAVELSTGKTHHRYRTGEHPRGMALHEDGRLFVNAMYGHKIHVLGEPQTKKGPSHTFDTCKYPRHAILSPEQTRLYVTCSGADKVYWYDPEKGRRLGWAKVGDNPRSMAMSEDGRYLAIADYDSSTVSLVDLVGGSYRTHELPGAKKVVGVAMSPGDDGSLRVYATSWVTRELIEMRIEPGSQREAVSDGATVEKAEKAERAD
jgi:YVTN family beta-propeller protein